MPKVEFKIGHQFYEIACGEGEEARIKTLAEGLNKRIDAISNTFSAASDNMILAITALMMEDELQSMAENDRIEDRNTERFDVANQNDMINVAVAEALEPVAEAIETLAKTLRE